MKSPVRVENAFWSLLRKAAVRAFSIAVLSTRFAFNAGSSLLTLSASGLTVGAPVIVNTPKTLPSRSETATTALILSALARVTARAIIVSMSVVVSGPVGSTGTTPLPPWPPLPPPQPETAAAAISVNPTVAAKFTKSPDFLNFPLRISCETLRLAAQGFLRGAAASNSASRPDFQADVNRKRENFLLVNRVAKLDAVFV